MMNNYYSNMMELGEAFESRMRELDAAFELSQTRFQEEKLRLENEHKALMEANADTMKEFDAMCASLGL